MILATKQLFSYNLNRLEKTTIVLIHHASWFVVIVESSSKTFKKQSRIRLSRGLNKKILRVASIYICLSSHQCASLLEAALSHCPDKLPVASSSITTQSNTSATKPSTLLLPIAQYYRTRNQSTQPLKNDASLLPNTPSTPQTPSRFMLHSHPNFTRIPNFTSNFPPNAASSTFFPSNTQACHKLDFHHHNSCR